MIKNRWSNRWGIRVGDVLTRPSWRGDTFKVLAIRRDNVEGAVYNSKGKYITHEIRDLNHPAWEFVRRIKNYPKESL